MPRRFFEQHFQSRDSSGWRIFPAPTFAAVHGACLGVGLGLALASDVVYVSEDAKIGSPFARIGAVLDSGGHKFFVQRIGPHRALELIYTGRLLSGTEAAAWGLVNQCVPKGESGRERPTAGGDGGEGADRGVPRVEAHRQDDRRGSGGASPKSSTMRRARKERPAGPPITRKASARSSRSARRNSRDDSSAPQPAAP